MAHTATNSDRSSARNTFVSGISVWELRGDEPCEIYTTEFLKCYRNKDEKLYLANILCVTYFHLVSASVMFRMSR